MMLAGVELTCPTKTCRVTFEVPAELRQKAIDKGQSVYCPNGHEIVWNNGKSRAERKAEERAEEAERRYKDAEAEEERAYTELHEERQRLAELAAMLRRCPICGHRSRKQIVERARAELMHHLVEKHKVGDGPRGLDFTPTMREICEEAAET